MPTETAFEVDAFQNNAFQVESGPPTGRVVCLIGYDGTTPTLIGYDRTTPTLIGYDSTAPSIYGVGDC